MKAAEIEEIARDFQFKGKRLSAKVEETHISWVLLTDEYAFKIKKPVKLSFVDFSTLSRRKKSCEKEVLLNRRLSTIYLGVVPVRSGNGSWYFENGAGRALDYAVVMRRMRSDKRMDLLLTRRQVTEEHISNLAGFIANFHAAAEIVSAPFVPLFARKLFNDVRTIDDFVVQNAGPDAGRIVCEAVTWSNSFLKQHVSRFRQRVALGYRRDLHGDLHSANIFLYRHPVIFDCIEFNDAFRHVDVLDEVAFLCMDLESFNYEHLAKTLLNSYSEIVPYLETSEDMKIFIYYKCFRANVRAKVHAIAAQREEDAMKRIKHIERMVRYLYLIDQYIQ